MSEDSYKATKGDIFGIIDYLQDGLGDYINNPGGRPYDDDEIINIRHMGSTLLRLAQSTNKGDDMTAISVGFEM
jgi:hypothetical protein